MSIYQAIGQAQQLVKQLSAQSKTDTKLLHLLSQELDCIASYANTLTATDSNNDIHQPDIKSGCYVFADEKRFFCPNCFDNTGQRVPTKRLNSKLRVCPQCRASIQPLQ